MKHSKLIVLVVLVAIFSIAGVSATLAQDSSAEADAQIIEVEVAEDGTRFVFGTEQLHEDGMPAYGSPFVTQGYIYPVGTLNGSNGVLANGEPEFPELVIGEWTCYGWMIGEGGHATTGEWVVSTQIYAFEDNIIVTNGFELADLNVPVARAITGGTGEYSGARGQMQQTLLGFTEQMGVNLTVELAVADTAQ